MIAALAGRRIDPAHPTTARFPHARIDNVERALRATFEADGVEVLVCAAACGADLLALSVATQLGIRRRIVLPFAPALFREHSVADRPDAYPWCELYDRFIAEAKAAGDLRLLGFAQNDPEVYEKTNEGILDEASALASAARDASEAVVVWDEGLRTDRDYTEHFLKAAAQRRMKIKEIGIVGDAPLVAG